MEQEPIRPTTCDHCGKRFNTSQVHPRRYCSIACEEGRGPLPMDNPSSDQFWLGVKNEPEMLVGFHLIASGLKRTCYSPEWHRNPSDYNQRHIVSHDTDNEILVYETDVHLGQVVEYDRGRYKVRYDEPDGSLSHYRWHEATMVVYQIREDNWWAE